jgi:hypothetical protein
MRNARRKKRLHQPYECVGMLGRMVAPHAIHYELIDNLLFSLSECALSLTGLESVHSLLEK